jgi:hypothetical protein
MQITFTSAQDATRSEFMLEVDGEKSTFSPGETAKINIYPGGKSPSLSISAGSATLGLTNQTKEITEYITFAKTDSSFLSYPAKTVKSALWVGRNCGKVTIKEKAISIPAVASGVLKVVYDTSYDQANVTCSFGAMTILEAENPDRYGYMNVDFTYGTDAELAETEVVIQVRSACTNSKLAGADVWLNGAYVGKSDSDGYVYLGKLPRGSYQVRAVRSGYLDTDQDNIANDSFTVE